MVFICPHLLTASLLLAAYNRSAPQNVPITVLAGTGLAACKLDITRYGKVSLVLRPLAQELRLRMLQRALQDNGYDEQFSKLLVSSSATQLCAGGSSGWPGLLAGVLVAVREHIREHGIRYVCCFFRQVGISSVLARCSGLSRF